MKIIKVGALWCPACLITNNELNKIKESYNIEVIEYDYDFDEEKVKELNIGTILPELIFIKDDKEVDRLIGEKRFKDIEGVIKKYEED
ncbi:MAG: thioredoxin family protein [Bacilli bacterium]|nr:thioredoxin family protein [Bacilli bacterium]